MKTIEKEQLKVKLTQSMSKFLNDVTHVDNNIGYLPENIDALMSDAAFAVLQTVTATNQYFIDEGFLKD